MPSVMRYVALLAAVLLPMQSHADFYLIVQAGSPQYTLTQKEAVDLFMRRNRAFSNGDFALVFDLPNGAPGRDAFYYSLTGLSQAQVNSYWARLTFSGRNLPPQAVPDERAMIEVVKASPRAIGWLNKDPLDRQVRTVLVLKEAP